MNGTAIRVDGKNGRSFMFSLYNVRLFKTTGGFEPCLRKTSQGTGFFVSMRNVLFQNLLF
jgi:hypothetical protein